VKCFVTDHRRIIALQNIGRLIGAVAPSMGSKVICSLWTSSEVLLLSRSPTGILSHDGGTSDVVVALGMAWLEWSHNFFRDLRIRFVIRAAPRRTPYR
jgi:hypothetical protein